MNIRKFLPYIILVLILTALAGAYFSRGAIINWFDFITEKVPPPKPKIEINLDVSTWETFQSERLGFSLKYPQEWIAQQIKSNRYPFFLSQDNKCIINTGVFPTDPGQTVEQWFLEKWDLGGFGAEILSYGFVTAAKQRGILAKFVEPPLKYKEPQKMGDLPLNPTIAIKLFLPVPKEDYVFQLGLGRAYEEQILAPECKNIFDLVIKSLELKPRKLD